MEQFVHCVHSAVINNMVEHISKRDSQQITAYSVIVRACVFYTLFLCTAPTLMHVSLYRECLKDTVLCVCF